MINPKIKQSVLDNWRRIILQGFATILSLELTLRIVRQEIPVSRPWCILPLMLFLFLAINLWNLIENDK